MEAGRELDSLIHHKVMGFPDATEPGISQAEYERRRVMFYPFYSTSIADAWEVVLKFDEVRLRKHGDGRWTCFMGSAAYWDATADTAPLAICLAALKAVGGV